MIVVAVTVIAAHDIGSQPGDGFGARLAVSAIDGYRAVVSPRLSGVVTCRFRPTCSVYGRASIEKHGLLRGSGRTVARLARCGPWTPAGAVDQP